MLFADLNLNKIQLQKLLGTADSDAALLYLYISCGNPPENAVSDLHISAARYASAEAMLRRLDLWPQAQKLPLPVGERPRYTEEDVIRAGRDPEFSALYGEVQRLLGKQLTTEELKILLGFVRYLGMEHHTVSMLVSFCIQRVRYKGGSRNPSLRSIEKEAYAWAELGIQTVEEAVAYIKTQWAQMDRMAGLMKILQIRGRNLTPGEEKFAKQWLEWGLSDDLIAEAYDRACLNTGSLNWRYMNRILSSWYEANYQTVQQALEGDRNRNKNKPRTLDDDERAALAKMMEG